MKYLITTLSLLISLAALAQTQPPARKITLDEAVKMGTDYSKTLRASAARTAAAHARTAELVNQFVPNINLSANYTRISNNITPLSIEFPGLGLFTLNPQILNQFYNKASVQYVLFAGFRAESILKSTEALEAATAADYNKDVSDVRYNIASAYLNYLKTLASQRVVNENETTYRSRLRDIRNMTAQGVALPLDTLRASLAVTNIQVNEADVQSAVEVNAYNLALMLGLPDGTPLDADTSIAVPAAPTLGDCMQTALKNRAELKAAQARLETSGYNVKTARGAYYPVLSAGANYYYNDPNQRVFPPEDKFKATWDAGLTLSWSLTQLYTNGASVREQQANAAAAEAQESQLNDAVKMDVNAAYSAYGVAKDKIALAEKSVQQAAENQRITQNRYNNSLALLSDLQDADFLLLQAQLNRVTAKTDAAQAYYKLMKSIGN